MRSEDLPKVNNVEITFNDKNIGKHEQVLIPAGKFTMGTEEDFFPIDGESPAREVFVSNFYIDLTAVTNENFSEFITATDYKTEAEIHGWSYVFKGLLNGESRAKEEI